MAMGTMIYNPYFYGGISLNHINNPDIRFIKVTEICSQWFAFEVDFSLQVLRYRFGDGKPGRSNLL